MPTLERVHRGSENFRADYPEQVSRFPAHLRQFGRRACSDDSQEGSGAEEVSDEDKLIEISSGQDTDSEVDDEGQHVVRASVISDSSEDSGDRRRKVASGTRRR